MWPPRGGLFELCRDGEQEDLCAGRPDELHRRGQAVAA